MSRSLNIISLIGNLGSDPEIRRVGDDSVASFSVATTETWKGKDGVLHEKTQWHRCNAWNGAKGTLADIAGQLLRKGSRVYVAGKMEYRKWTDKDGVEKVSAEVNVREIIALDKKPADAPSPSAKKAADDDGDGFADEPGSLPFEPGSLPF